MTKQVAIATINDLPQEFELDELIERLIFIDKVERGLVQLDQGQTKSHNSVKEFVKKWQK